MQARVPVLAAMLLAGLCSLAHAITPAEQLATFSAQAGAPAQAERGQRFFTTKHGRD